MVWYFHDDVIKWKHFPRYWPFVRGIPRSPVNSPHKGQWRGALMCSSICAWINRWVNNREAGDLRRHRAHYDAIVMCDIMGYSLKSQLSLRRFTMKTQYWASTWKQNLFGKIDKIIYRRKYTEKAIWCPYIWAYIIVYKKKYTDKMIDGTTPEK